MKQTVLRYGLWSGLVICLLFLASFLIFHDTNFEAQEVFGYTSIILSLLFVFFGMRHYRDKVNNGVLSFGRGMKVGTLIVLIPSLIFGLFNILYVIVINPGFYKRYMEHMKETMPAAEYQVAAKEMEMWANPMFSFAIMAVTVFMIGMIVTVISSLILRRRAASY